MATINRVPASYSNLAPQETKSAFTPGVTTGKGGMHQHYDGTYSIEYEGAGYLVGKYVIRPIIDSSKAFVQYAFRIASTKPTLTESESEKIPHCPNVRYRDNLAGTTQWTAVSQPGNSWESLIATLSQDDQKAVKSNPDPVRRLQQFYGEISELMQFITNKASNFTNERDLIVQACIGLKGAITIFDLIQDDIKFKGSQSLYSPTDPYVLNLELPRYSDNVTRPPCQPTVTRYEQGEPVPLKLDNLQSCLDKLPQVCPEFIVETFFLDTSTPNDSVLGGYYPENKGLTYQDVVQFFTEENIAKFSKEKTGAEQRLNNLDLNKTITYYWTLLRDDMWGEKLRQAINEVYAACQAVLSSQPAYGIEKTDNGWKSFIRNTNKTVSEFMTTTCL